MGPLFAAVLVLASISQPVSFVGGSDTERSVVVSELELSPVPPLSAPIGVVLGPDVPSQGGCSGITLTGADPWALAHEFGHAWDCQTLTVGDRALFSAALGRAGEAWRGGAYAGRLDELFASAYADWLFVKTGRFEAPRFGGVDAVAVVAAHHTGVDAPTRGDLAELLAGYGFASAPSRWFPDVPVGHPDFDAVSSAAGAGMFIGYADGTFRPDQPASRFELRLVLDRVADYVALAAQ